MIRVLAAFAVCNLSFVSAQQVEIKLKDAIAREKVRYALDDVELYKPQEKVKLAALAAINVDIKNSRDRIIHTQYKNVNLERTKKYAALTKKRERAEKIFLHNIQRACIYGALCVAIILLSENQMAQKKQAKLISALIQTYGITLVGYGLMIFDLLKSKLIGATASYYGYQTWQNYKDKKECQEQLDKITFLCNPWQRVHDEMFVISKA